MTDKWLYIDDEGETQGPFSTAQLTAWFNHGYFKSSTLCKNEGTDQFKPMKLVFPPAIQQQLQQTQSDGDKQQQDEYEYEDEYEDEDEDEDEEDEYKDVDDDQTTSPTGSTSSIPGEEKNKDDLDVSPSSDSVVSKWFYLDDSGVEQGPFTTLMMQQWFDAGYFKRETKVRRETEGEFRQIKDRSETDFVNNNTQTTDTNTSDTAIASSSSISTSTTTSLSTGSSSSSLTDSSTSSSSSSSSSLDDWYYLDNNSVERGPFSTDQMRYWHFKGYFTYNDCQIRCANSPSPYSSYAALRFHYPPPPFIFPITPNLAERWYYLDDSRTEQGPFTTEIMREWFKAGFIKQQVLVKLLGEQREYTPIIQRYCSFTVPATIQPPSIPSSSSSGIPMISPSISPSSASAYGVSVAFGRGSAQRIASDIDPANLNAYDLTKNFYDHELWQQQMNQARNKKQRMK